MRREIRDDLTSFKTLINPCFFQAISMTDEETLQLIDVIFRHSAIWDRKHPQYKNINRRNDD